MLRSAQFYKLTMRVYGRLMGSVAHVNTRQQQREQTRLQILEAAIPEFARAGFDAASLADIAARAGVKKALVQYHFATKELLWQAAADRIWHERNGCMEIYFAERGEEPMAGVRAAFTALVQFTRERPQWLWFMFHEAAAGTERLSWLIEHWLRRDYLTGESFIEHFQRRGLVRQGPPLQMLHMITGALTYNLLVAPQTLQATGVDLVSSASIEQQVDLLLAMIAAPA
ncbi:MAG: TetR/AcrR family transcriptional regulator [Pseudomonadota bacterium]